MGGQLPMPMDSSLGGPTASWTRNYAEIEQPELEQPRVEFKENQQKYLIRVELPGIEQDAIKVHVAPGVLSIFGLRKTHHRFSALGLNRMPFLTQVKIPEMADARKVKARFQDGVLHLSIFKKPEDQSRAE
jgi:HSP20 family protein